MQVKLTIGERLKDLRVERKLTLEELADAVGISKSALGKYESDNGKDISPYSIVQLADFYGVSADYLMGRTETKNHPNTTLDELHLSDGAIDVLRDGRFNKRLLSEILCHPEFQTMMLDAEIYADRIASTQIKNMNAAVDAMRAKLSEQKVDDLWLRTLGKSHLNEDEYFGRLIYDDMMVILKEIQQAHIQDATTADDVSALEHFKQSILTAGRETASKEEMLLKTFCDIMGLKPDALEPEEFRVLIKACEKSPKLKQYQSQRGKANMTHGSGKRKRR